MFKNWLTGEDSTNSSQVIHNMVNYEWSLDMELLDLVQANKDNYFGGNTEEVVIEFLNRVLRLDGESVIVRFLDYYEVGEEVNNETIVGLIAEDVYKRTS